MNAVFRNIGTYGFNRYALKEVIAASPFGRWAYSELQLARGRRAAAADDFYLWARAICQATRLLEGRALPSKLIAQHRHVLQAAGVRESGAAPLSDNAVLASFVKSQTAQALRAAYTRYGESFAIQMKHPRDNDDATRQGNLVVLKAPDAATAEKGVLYLQYTESIASFVALYDIAAVARQYRLVLEPSTWGYQDVSYLLLIGREFDVVVQAQDEPDFDYIESLHSNLSPLRQGAGDWIDPARFTSCPPVAKEHDFVMVASWSPMKRHRLLFHSLAAAGLREKRLALIGYAIDGRTRHDVEKMARAYGLTNVSVFDSIAHSAVAQIIARSQVGIMLSLREGANRGIYECLLSDVPVVLSRANRGVNKQLINARTGSMASDAELPQALRSALEQSARFTPRAWALKNTGSNIAYDALQQRLAELARAAGEPYERPIARIRSAPNTGYARDEDRLLLAGQYRALAALRRP